MSQLSINFTPEAKARRSDPESSKQAARKAAKFATSHAGRILAALKQHGPMSPAQMFDHTGLSVVQIDRRGKEMREAGLVQFKRLDDGAIAMHAGCQVWEAV